MPRRKRVLGGTVAAAVVLLGVLVFGLLRARGVSVPVAPVVRRDLEQHLVASGRVWVPTRVQITAQTPGLVLAVPVVEGASVAAGTLLVQIDEAEARASVAQAKAAVAQANARVEQLRRVGAIVATEGLRQADTNLARAEADRERAETLASAGAIPPIELEQARRAVDLARAQRTAAEAQQIGSTPLGAESRVALTARLQAETQLASANVRLAQTRLVALQDGVVLTRSVEPGDVAQPGRTLLVLAAASDTQLVIHPDERSLAWVALGQRARVSADAYPRQVFDAEVSHIAPSIDPQRGSVEVRLRVPGAPKQWKPDMTVSVDLLVASASRVLTVPNEAVRGAATPSPWVLAVASDHLARRDVMLGIGGDGSVEIAGGLDEGTLVVLPDGRSLAPGQRVRPEHD